MWTCPKCKEQIDDKFDSCWKCAGEAAPPPPKTKKPFEQFEALCIVIALLPGIIFFMHGHVQNHAQAVFRIATIIVFFIVGFGALAAIKVYQRTKARDRK
jgi:hypothetical protein